MIAPPWWRFTLQSLLVLLVYGLTGFLGLTIEPVAGVATLVWPPTGIAIAAVILLGLRIVPSIFLGAVLVGVLARAPFLPGLGIALGNSAEAVIAAWLLERTGFHRTLDRARDVLAFILLAAVLATMVSATSAVVSLYLGRIDTSLSHLWRVWWLGDAIGALIIAPLLLSWFAPAAVPWTARRIAEGALVVLLQTALCLLVFGAQFETEALLYRWAVFPGLVWAAMRCGTPIATTAMLATSLVAVWDTAHGHGPFPGLAALQVFLGVGAITTLFLAATVEERRRAVLRREQTLHIVSHDLKNPLTVIQTVSVLLHRLVAGDPKPQVHEALERVDRAIRRMRGVLGDLVDSAQLDSGRLSLDYGTCRLGDVVDEALQTVHESLVARNIALEKRLEAAEIEAAVDRNRIVRVLDNLLGNALKFTPEGGRITISLALRDGFARFGVADTGPGVPPDKLTAIFEPYYQVQKHSQGLGLGLYIAKGFVEAHGGSIWCQCGSGGGANFYFTLPLRDPAGRCRSRA